MNETILKVENIFYKQKKDNLDILKDVSFEITKGQSFALLGHNGSGKSTLIDIITESLKPSSGSVTVLQKRFMKVKNSVGVLYDNVPIFVVLKVKEIIHYISAIYKSPASKIEKIISTLEMESIQDKLFKVLSKGERKKVGVLLALLGDTEFLIMDEPTSDLDPLIRDKCWRLFKDDDRTILFTSHLWEEAEKYADIAAFIYKGTLISSPAPVAELLSEKYLPYKAKAIITKEKASKFSSLKKYEHTFDGDICFIWSNNIEEVRKELDAESIGYSISSKELKDVYLYLSKTKEP